jgi:hypothetical protein
MINYYFFQFIKKNFGPDRTEPWTVPWGSGPQGPTVGRVRVFRIWTALDRTVRTVRDRGPSGFEPDRPGPDRVQYSTSEQLMN